MKKILIGTVLTIATLTGFSSAFAETLDVSIAATPEITTVSATTERAESLVTKNLLRIKARGSQLIKERINSLTSNGKVIAESNKLSTEQKASFATIISTNIAGLTTLGNSIAANTEASSTKTLVNKIYTDFRIYAIVLPQIRLEKRINELQNHIPKLTEAFVKIQTKIDAQKAKGKDVTVWQKSLDDAKVLVTADTAKLATLFVQISALKPADYGTSSKAIIESVNAGVKTIAKNFSSIAKVARHPMNLHSTTTATTSISR